MQRICEGQEGQDPRATLPSGLLILWVGQILARGCRPVLDISTKVNILRLAFRFHLLPGLFCRVLDEFLDTIMAPEQLGAYRQQPHFQQHLLWVVRYRSFPIQRVLNAPVGLLDIERHLFASFEGFGQKKTKETCRIGRAPISRLFHNHRDIDLRALFPVLANMYHLPRAAIVPAPTARWGEGPRAAHRAQRASASLFPLHDEVKRRIAQSGLRWIGAIALFARHKSDRSLWDSSDLEGEDAVPIGTGSSVEFLDKHFDLSQRLLAFIRNHPGQGLQHFGRR